MLSRTHKPTTNPTAASSAIFTIFLSVAAIAGMLASPIARADSAIAGVSTPQVSLVLEPYAPDGTMRLYTVPNGVSYWTQDMPIYQGDTVKLDVFVATGADELQDLKVRMDNVLVADISKSPWTTTLTTSRLGSGYHFVEAWVQVSGQKPQFATHTLTFFVNPTPPSTGVDQPVAQVKGQEQILTNGQVVSVPLDPNATSAAPQTPATPPVLASASSDAGATVKIVLNDAVSNAVLDQSTNLQLASPAVASIVPLSGSTAQKFAYELQRGDETIVMTNQIFPADATKIRLQPRTSTTPGLLPGTTTRGVWGVDAQGNYGTPVSATVQIQPSTGE